MKFLDRLIHPSSKANSSTATAAPISADNNAHPHIHRTTSASSIKRHHDRTAEERTSRHLILVTDSPTVSPHLVHTFQAEGFDVTHLPFGESGDLERDRKTLENLVNEKEDELEEGERYAIVAYHRPAYLLLASHHLSASNTNPFPRLCALIAYYPLLKPKPNSTAGDVDGHGHETSQFQFQDDNEDGEEEDDRPACMKTDTIFSPETKATYLPIQIHLAGRRHPEFNNGGCSWPWISASPFEGDVTYKKRHRCYVFDYPEAEIDNGNGLESDAIRSRLAWSRMLGCLRRSFGVGAHWPVEGIETVWEAYWMRLWSRKNNIEKEQSAMGLLAGERHGRCAEDLGVECAPTAAAAGTNAPTLESFFTHPFISAGPASQHIRLLSRTVGPGRIVDEVQVSFRHTAEIPWLLPDVTPTNRDVQIVIVVVASFCAGSIASQKVYWDQASVLVQVGLLDGDLVPRMD